MSSTENLIKATLNRFAARVKGKLIETMADINLITKDAPYKIRKEWDLFQEEVLAEADRLEKQKSTQGVKNNSSQNVGEIDSPQEQIDRIRKKVAELNRKIGVKN